MSEMQTLKINKKHKHEKTSFHLIAYYSTLLDLIQVMPFNSTRPLYPSCRVHRLYTVYISCRSLFFPWLFQDCRRSGVSGEMDFLSAWIVSPSALPFLCLIWGKRIKCHHGAIITVTVAFSSAIRVQAIQLSSGNLDFTEALNEFSL